MKPAAPALFFTLAGREAGLIAAARERQRPAARQARIFAGPACPICGRPGLHRDLTGGTEIIHGFTERCWDPSASACGIDTTAPRKEAA